MSKNESNGIVYSCYHEVSRQGENFVPQHTLSYQISGNFILQDNQQKHTTSPGELYLFCRNQLVKFTKLPPAGGVFESLSIYLDQEMLRNFAEEYTVKADNHILPRPFIQIPTNEILSGYMQSIQLFSQSGQLQNKALMNVKTKEVLLLLLEFQPALKDLLFDFSEPHKIDLEAFMNQHFSYNVKLERFAYLTGRSLATFKRDFQKVFEQSPHKWILAKRLDEAHFLIKEKRKKASDIYLDLGFEDLSHFSYTFKKQFGYPPTEAR